MLKPFEPAVSYLWRSPGLGDGSVVPVFDIAAVGFVELLLH